MDAMEQMHSDIDAYVAYITATGRADTTARMHRYVLTDNLTYLHSHGRNCTAATITKDDMMFLVLHKDIRESTMRQYLSVIDRFVWALDHRHPFRDLDLQWNSDGADRLFITKEDLDRVLAVAPPRARIELVLGAYMGLRSVEMQRLKESDIRDGRMLVTGKGHRRGKQAWAIIPSIVSGEIGRYLQWKRSLPVKDSSAGHLIFVYSKDMSEIFPVDPCVDIVYTDIKRAGRKAGIRITPHSLRRLFATTLYYELQVDLVTVRDLMRHSDASTTMRHYIQAYDRKRTEAMDKVNAYFGTHTRTHTLTQEDGA